MEFPHLLRLIEHNQFDTIYHEHFSYFSFSVAEGFFASPRTHAVRRRRAADARRLAAHLRCTQLRCLQGGHRTRRRSAGTRGAIGTWTSLLPIAGFAERVRETKRALLTFLIEAKRAGKPIVGYGAPGKGNTLLNYCGIGTDFIDFTVDRNPYKQGKFTPGAHIPILHPDATGKGPARLHPDPAVESQGRSRRDSWKHTGIERALRRPDSHRSHRRLNRRCPAVPSLVVCKV